MDPIEYIENHRANIEKNRKKNFIRFILIVVLVAILVVVVKQIFLVPPKIIFESNNNKIQSITGGYNWKFLMFNNNKNDINTLDTIYNEDNILYVNSGDEIYFSNSRRQNMKNLKISFYNMDLGTCELKSNQIDAEENDIYINAPEEIGTYVYTIEIEYQNENKVQYAFKVIVKQDIDELKQYENSTDVVQIDKLVKILPYGKYIQNIGINNNAIELNYKDTSYIEDDVIFNNIVLFTCINSVDTINYKTDNSEFVVTKSSLHSVSNLGFDAINQYINIRTVLEVKEENSDDKKFKGVIQSITDNNIIVKVDDSEDIKKTTDLVTVPADNVYEFAPQDKVEVTYTGDILETYPAQIYLVGIKKVEDNKINMDLASIPLEYTKEQAIKDGYYILTRTVREYNYDKFEQFTQKVKNKQKANIRIVSFTQNNDLVITDINYGDGQFQVNQDLRRDSSLDQASRVCKQSTYNYFDSANVNEYENKTATIQNVMFITIHDQNKFYLY